MILVPIVYFGVTVVLALYDVTRRPGASIVECLYWFCHCCYLVLFEEVIHIYVVHDVPLHFTYVTNGMIKAIV